jgi:hypothetical protein
MSLCPGWQIEVFDLDQPPLSANCRTLEQNAKLTNVAGPRARLQCPESPEPYAQMREAARASDPLQQVGGEQ